MPTAAVRTKVLGIIFDRINFDPTITEFSTMQSKFQQLLRRLFLTTTNRPNYGNYVINQYVFPLIVCPYHLLRRVHCVYIQNFSRFQASPATLKLSYMYLQVLNLYYSSRYEI